MIPDNSNKILWNMTKKCNFRCKYCYFPHDNTPVESEIDPNNLLTFLNSTKKEWTIGMTGGEPFLYPDFVEICEKLTENHIIAIDTNLSIVPRVRRFAETIDPHRVKDLYIALHIEERERLKGVEQFIENVLLLMKKGFHVSVNYVIHPTLVDRFNYDYEYFISKGIKLIPRPFKGIYDGLDYPLNYSPKAKELFLSKPKAGRKIVYNFKGVPCNAGRRLIRLEPNGDILRCPGDRSLLGNINSSVTLYEKPEPCRVSRCPCSGLDYVTLDEYQDLFISGLSDFILGKSKEAAQSYEKSIQLNPEASSSYNNLGIIRWQEDDLEGALSCFKKAFETHPFNKIYVMNYARLLAITGDRERAQEICQSLQKHYNDKEIEALCKEIEASETSLKYSPRICVDVIPENTKTVVFET